MTSTTTPPPEYNQTGIDLYDQTGFRYRGLALIDVHAHVTVTRPPAAEGQPTAPVESNLEPAERMLDVAQQFGVRKIYSMCPVEDIGVLRERFGDLLAFNGSIAKSKIDEPDAAAYARLDNFLAAGITLLKFWAAPRGRDRGLLLDAPWRIEAAKRARAAGIRVVMVHVADPDVWFDTVYADAAKYGTKADQYVPLRRMLEAFPDLTWIAAHMGGDVEHPDHLEELLERYPHLHFDTSATKWQVREASPRRDAVHDLIRRHADRFLFGSDLVTRPGLHRDHYASRYWCQRMLWESAWEGPSPIADPDYHGGTLDAPTPTLRGLNLPLDVLERVYYRNAARLLDDTGSDAS
ncbi:MAG: amidohydrolase family protein [Gemmataceae bacterium]